jgi:hypothetical protein
MPPPGPRSCPALPATSRRAARLLPPLLAPARLQLPRPACASRSHSAAPAPTRAHSPGPPPARAPGLACTRQRPWPRRSGRAAPLRSRTPLAWSCLLPRAEPAPLPPASRDARARAPGPASPRSGRSALPPSASAIPPARACDWARRLAPAAASAARLPVLRRERRKIGRDRERE